MNPYEVLLKNELTLREGGDLLKCDLFLSGYNLSERVKYVYERCTADRKVWIVAEEYGIEKEKLPETEAISVTSGDESELSSPLQGLFCEYASGRICVDITGMVRSHVLFCLRIAWASKAQTVEFLYSEPTVYKNKESTPFTMDGIVGVRQVYGFEGEHFPSERDVLIVGAGYDQAMLAAVFESKSKCRPVLLFGFPPLVADMYQENVLKASQVESSKYGAEMLFAPANDPFVTASILSESVRQLDLTLGAHNLYLSPHSTKAQTLGFGIFFLTEKQASSTSIIYPFSRRYSNDTTLGTGRIWQYIVELESLRRHPADGSSTGFRMVNGLW